jgi:hypothetical protein
MDFWSFIARYRRGASLFDSAIRVIRVIRSNPRQKEKRMWVEAHDVRNRLLKMTHTPSD